MTSIKSIVAPPIAPEWDYLPEKAGRALTELTRALGPYADKLDIDFDRQGRIEIRMPGNQEVEAKVRLKAAGVRETKSNVGNFYNYDYKGFEVVVAPYQRATLAGG
jgi:hypothetical protein